MKRFLFLSLLVACGGADESPLLDSGANNGGDGGGGDVIVGNDSSPIDTGLGCDVSKCVTVPQGFRAVRSVDAKASCPSGWVSDDGVTNPVAAGDACSCNCNVTQNPDCTNGKIFRALDDTTSPTCGTAATTLAGNGGACTQIGQSLFLNHTHYVADPPPPSGGACQYDAQLDKGKLSGTPARVCAPPQGCQGAICDGGPICVATDGDQACPADFPTKTLVGQSVSGTCGSCGSCSAAGTCTGTLSFFSDQNCTLGESDFVADAVCKANPASTSTGYLSYTWKGSLAKATCAGTPSSTAQAQLDKPVTVCCK